MGWPIMNSGGFDGVTRVMYAPQVRSGYSTFVR
jgi:hypothetical protein